jgi:hypothetical protein
MKEEESIGVHEERTGRETMDERDRATFSWGS